MDLACQKGSCTHQTETFSGTASAPKQQIKAAFIKLKERTSDIVTFAKCKEDRGSHFPHLIGLWAEERTGVFVHFCTFRINSEATTLEQSRTRRYYLLAGSLPVRFRINMALISTAQEGQVGLQALKPKPETAGQKDVIIHILNHASQIR